MRTTARFLALATALSLAIIAAPADPAAASEGICPELGCVGGETKCADGTYETTTGIKVKYNCYTTIRTM